MLTGGGGQWGGGEHSGRDAFLLTAHRAFLPSTSGPRRKSKHGCVSNIDPPHRPRSSLPRCGTKVNIRYRGCSIRLGRANQPEFCLSPHQSRLLLVDSTHTINRGREDERVGQKGRSRAHPFGKKTKYCTATTFHKVFQLFEKTDFA